MIARRYDITVITAAQFNRQGNERSGGDLRLGDISRSFNITNPCAFVFGIRIDGERMILRILKANDCEPVDLSLRANFQKMILTEEATWGGTNGQYQAFAPEQ